MNEEIKEDLEILERMVRKTDNEIDICADRPNELHNINPLYAHIKINQILDILIRMLKREGAG